MPVRAVPDPTGSDAAKRALEQAAQLRQEVADLEEELAKGWWKCFFCVFRRGSSVRHTTYISILCSCSLLAPEWFLRR